MCYERKHCSLYGLCGSVVLLPPPGYAGRSSGVQPERVSSLLCPLCQDQAVLPASTRSFVFLWGGRQTPFPTLGQVKVRCSECAPCRAWSPGYSCCISETDQAGTGGLSRKKCSRMASGLMAGRPGHGAGTSFWKLGACPEGRTLAMPDSWLTDHCP